MDQQTLETIVGDLKQFIAATVSQATADMATKTDIADMATKTDIANMATKDDISQLRQEMKQGFTDLKLEMHTIADGQAEDLIDYGQRITKLEKSAAN